MGWARFVNLAHFAKKKVGNNVLSPLIPILKMKHLFLCHTKLTVHRSDKKNIVLHPLNLISDATFFLSTMYLDRETVQIHYTKKRPIQS